ncbi:hypothetical protein [Undibacterium fentianense]|nr:hypothetical protein [Undibacterium fentianense]
MPRQGTLPHDLIHFVVESSLPFRYGFLNLVAAGAEASFAMELAHDKSLTDIDVEAIQVEAIVEALQTQLWGAYFDFASFDEANQLACSARGKTALAINEEQSLQLYQTVLDLFEQWQALPFHSSMPLHFDDANESEHVSAS